MIHQTRPLAAGGREYSRETRERESVCVCELEGEEKKKKDRAGIFFQS